MILVLSNSRYDGHADAVCAILARSRAEFFRFDTNEYPGSISLQIALGPGSTNLTLRAAGAELDLRRVGAVWNRRPERPTVLANMSPGDREFATAEAMHVLRSVWHALADRRWVNPYEASHRAEHKPLQLAAARAAGLAIPRTLLTNDPQEAVSFCCDCGGRVVYKTMSGHTRPGPGAGALAIYTRRMDSADVEARSDRIRLAPCLFQEYVPKDYELRVTVIGEEVFAARINSQRRASAQDDWRRRALDPALFEPGELPATVEAKIRCLVSALGLVFACIDIIVTPEGEYVFLEVNPNGQWLWLERMTGHPLAERFALLLVRADGGSASRLSRSAVGGAA